jgi:type IV pilus assembly protein PilN
MIQINLLPVRARKKKENVRQLISIYFLTLFLAIAAMGFLWVSQKNQIGSLKQKQSSLKVEVDKYAKYEKMLQEMTKQKEIMDKKRATIEALQKDRDEAVRALALLSVEVPPDKIWFNKLTKTANNLTLSGFAVSNEAIVEFMRNLESSPYVAKGSVSLTRSRQSTVANSKLREFDLTYRFFPYSEMQTQLKVEKP